MPTISANSPPRQARDREQKRVGKHGIDPVAKPPSSRRENANLTCTVTELSIAVRGHVDVTTGRDTPVTSVPFLPKMPSWNPFTSRPHRPNPTREMFCGTRAQHSSAALKSQKTQRTEESARGRPWDGRHRQGHCPGPRPHCDRGAHVTPRGAWAASTEAGAILFSFRSFLSLSFLFLMG